MAKHSKVKAMQGIALRGPSEGSQRTAKAWHGGAQFSTAKALRGEVWRSEGQVPQSKAKARLSSALRRQGFAQRGFYQERLCERDEWRSV